MKNLLILSASIFSIVFAFNQSMAQGLPQCVSSTSDTDGDGYGWENGESCVSVPRQQGQAAQQLNYCQVARPVDNQPPFCSNDGQVPVHELVYCEDNDGDGWGWNSAIVNRFSGIGPCAAPTNLVRNGSFDNGSEGWNTFLHPDSIAEPYEVLEGVIDPPYPSRFTFLTTSTTIYPRASFEWRRAGTQWWHSQLFTDPISLEGGRTYRLSFTAGTNFLRTGGAVGSVVVENGTDFMKYLGRLDFVIPSDESRWIYYAEFHVPVSDSNARVTFNLGDNYGGNHIGFTGGLFIDSVRLIALTASSDQEVVSSNCDYSNALANNGWGWDSVAGESCPPQSVGSAACIDNDGDGWGWDGTGSCRP